MSGSSPLRTSGITLAQKFAFKPSESSSPSTSAVKKRKLADGDSVTTATASSPSSSAVATASASASASATKTKDPQAGLASIFKKKPKPSGDSVSTSIPIEESPPLTKGKKRALSEELEIATGADASNFQDSLSTSALPGVGGDLSQRQLLELECDTLHPSWLGALKKELKSSYFTNLKRFLWTEGVKNEHEASKTIFPPAREIYSWSRYTPLDKVRVVILGQDPYHNDGQAHGLAFSVRSNVRAPPSLKNIYKEVKNDYPSFVAPQHGYLGSWAEQGVLLLNTCLTVRAHQANSHSKKGWEQFTDSVLRVIDARPGPGVVFLAWGAPAQKRMAGINKKKHLILSSAHPSPLSASRGFFGNSHFKKANEWLVERYGEESKIDWCKLEAEKV